MNTPLKLKHLLFVLIVFLLGAGVVAGTGLYDNIVLNSYADFKTPTTTTTGLSASSRVYYDSANQGLAVSNNAGTGVQLMDGRNKIINGNFNVWQRGIALNTATTGTNTYWADRWLLQTAVTGSNDQSESTNISGVNGSYNAILIQPHTTNTAGATSYLVLGQTIEGYNLIPLNNQVCTISFWAKTNLTGTYSVAFTSGASDESYVIDWVVANTNWNKYVYTFTHSNAAGTWSYTNGAGLRVLFGLVVGSSFQQTAGSWQVGNKFGSAAMTNTFTNATTNTMLITQVQLEQGPTATQFEQMDYVAEFAKCQRYYWASYDPGVAPGTITGVGRICMIGLGSLNRPLLTVRHPVQMRVVPTYVVYNPATGAIGTIRDENANVNFSANFNTTSTTSFEIFPGGTPALADDLDLHVTASADF